MTQKKYFSEVDTQPDFPQKEAELLQDWYESGLVTKYLSKNNSSSSRFSFQDGPITANNPMGVHHAWGRSFKDLWQKFYNMRGFKQRFRNGFDCQGLWVEVEVEKELGLRSKKDIENLVPGDRKASIAKFVELCKERVYKYAEIQTDQSKRLGYFMDWDNSYFTMSEENNYMIWHFLKVCHDHGWIYKGKDSVPWCPRCETAISQHEMLTEDYKELVHQAIYLELPLVGEEKEYLLIWTTTPWTIPANIAVAVDEKLDYSLVEGETKDKFWVAKEAVERIFKDTKHKVIKTVKGKALVGKKYSGPFDHLPAVSTVAKENPDTFHTVIPSDPMILPVTTTEGTGLVHTAVSAGMEDFKLGKKLGLPMIPVIADDASYLDGFGFLSGKNAKKHPELILDYLKDEDKKGNDWVFLIQNYKHRYPACWRCKTELVWKVADEWYIAMDKASTLDKKDKRTLRARMIDVAKTINWIPSFGLDRELDWLTNMHDWLISKPNRYWGLALPIYECKKCGSFEVLGAKDELKKKATKGWVQFEGNTPHKPWIDEVKIKCSKCGESVSRIEDVGNPWLDAGIVPFSTISENNEATPLYVKNKEEWRKWFPVDFITESFPGQFKNWFYAMLAMSTVLEDERPYKTVLGFATLLAEDGRPMHKSWGNSIEFNEGAGKIGVDVMRWLYARQDPSENLLFGYKIADEVRRRFHLKLWNVYNFFVTYANADGWMPKENSAFSSPKARNPLDTWLLSRLSQTVTEMTAALDSYKPNAAAISAETLLEDMSNWYIRRSRDRVGPGAEEISDSDDFYATTYFVLTNFVRLLAPFMPFIPELIWRNLTKRESIHLEEWPEKTNDVNEKLILDMAKVREIVEIGHALRKVAGIPVRQPLSALITTMPQPPIGLSALLEEELNVKKWQVTDGKTISNKLDINITPELEEEAKTRELIRQIQQERKALGLGISDKTSVKAPWLPQEPKLLAKVKALTLSETLTEGEFKISKIS